VVDEHRLAKQRPIDVEEAGRVLDRDYMQDVDNAADEIIQRWNDEADGDIHDIIHEVIDGQQRVIYTHQAQLGLAFSKNASSYIEDFGEEGLIRDGSIHWRALMYAAMDRDVIEALERKGFDVNDPPGLDEDEENEENEEDDD